MISLSHPLPIKPVSAAAHPRRGFIATIRFQMPREHGAWGILLVPLFSAAALAASWNAPLFLAAVCALAFFLLHGSLEAQAVRNEWKALLAPGHLLLVAGAAASAGLLVFHYQRWQLLGLGFVAAALYGIQRWLLHQHEQNGTEKRSVSAELISVALLTLTAPATWIAARGSLFAPQPASARGDLAGVKLWLLNLLFFLGGILYVKYRVRGLLAHRKFHGIGERLAFAWPVFLYHLLLVVLVAGSVIHGCLPAAVFLAFTPGLVRVTGLAVHLGRRFPIRRLGWIETAHAATFAGLLILVFRYL